MALYDVVQGDWREETDHLLRLRIHSGMRTTLTGTAMV